MTTTEGTVAGAGPVPFAETLTAAADLSATVIADDDAAPPNRKEQPMVAVEGWETE